MMFMIISRNLVNFLSKKSSSRFLLYTSVAKQQTETSSSITVELLLHKHNFSPQLAARVASVLKNPQNCDSILSYLKQSGFSDTQLEKIFRYRPRFAAASLENSIKPKIQVLRDSGFSAVDIARIISSSPVILHCSADKRLIPSLTIIRDLLGCDEGVVKILKSFGTFLTKDLHKSLIPNVNFLKSCGVSMERILKIIYPFPRFLLNKPDTIKSCVEKADAIGVQRSSKMFIHAVRVVSSMTNESLKVKFQAFRDLGFSDIDILRVFRTAPPVIAVSEKKMKDVKEVLLATGKYDMSCIVNNPTSLCCSIEKRYKPRLRVLEILESKNLITDWPGLGTLYTMSDARFFKKFVSPYVDEVGDVYRVKSRTECKREAKLVPSTK